MSTFFDSVIAIAPVHTRKGRNRFLRDWDRWNDRLLRKGLIDIEARQRLRRELAEACWAAR